MARTELRTVYGTIAVPGGEDLISRALARHGEWAYSETELLTPLLRDGDALWDVGAFIGTFTLGLAARGKPGRVLAVEPGAEVFPLLQDNLAAHLACPHETVRTAVVARPGDSFAATADPANLGARRGTEGADRGAAMIGQTLRDLRARHGDYDFLKLDIEGMETAALGGDHAYLRERRPVIWAECNEAPASLDLLKVLTWLGYRPLYIAFPCLRRAAFNAAAAPLFPVAYEAGLLAADPARLSGFTPTVAGEDLIVRPVETGYDLCRALWDTPRWGKADWAAMSRPELIARLGRTERGEDLQGFCDGLRPPADTKG